MTVREGYFLRWRCARCAASSSKSSRTETGRSGARRRRCERTQVTRATRRHVSARAQHLCSHFFPVGRSVFISFVAFFISFVCSILHFFCLLTYASFLRAPLAGSSRRCELRVRFNQRNGGAHTARRSRRVLRPRLRGMARRCGRGELAAIPRCVRSGRASEQYADIQFHSSQCGTSAALHLLVGRGAPLRGIEGGVEQQSPRNWHCVGTGLSRHRCVSLSARRRYEFARRLRCAVAPY